MWTDRHTDGCVELAIVTNGCLAAKSLSQRLKMEVDADGHYLSNTRFFFL